MADTILQIVRQEDVEKRFNRKLIDGYIRDFITSDAVMIGKTQQGIQLLTDWMSKSYYESKNARLAQLNGIDIEKLVIQVFTGVAYCQEPELFTSVTAQLADRLGFDDKKEAITTIAEIAAVLCLTDAFDIGKEGKFDSLKIISRIPLPQETIDHINGSLYLPPMVCEPLELTDNYSSGYLSHNDSLILGKKNHHDGNICLDVLNTVNRVTLKLDMQFLCEVQEDPKEEFTVENVVKKYLNEGKFITEEQALPIVQKQIDNWHRFKSHSQGFYLLMHELGNEFYLTHKVDKRGRLYAQGYHISTQGTAYKKAMIELAHEELIEGMPTK